MNKYILGFLFTLYSGSMIHTMPKVTTSSQSQPHACPYPGCTKSYHYKSQLNTHINIEHKKIRYACPHEGCNKEYKTPTHLNIHIDSAHNNIIHKCPYEGCDKEYPYQSTLRTHINIEHKNIKNKCPYEGCNKEYKYYTGLRYHMDSAHKNIRYACSHEECNKTFKSPKSLTNHLKKAHANTNNQSDAQSSDNNLLTISADNHGQELVNEIDNNHNESLSPAMLLEKINNALDADNIELAQKLIESAPIDIINQIKTQLLYSIIIKNKINLIAALNNKN